MKRKYFQKKIITINRKAQYQYFIEDKIEAGIILKGWEVKSFREHSVQINESYITLKKGEAFIINVHLHVPITTCLYSNAKKQRDRKLLLHKKEINKLIGKIKETRYTIIPLKVYWKKHRIKVQIAIAKGKKNFDKRFEEKKKEWKMQKLKILKNTSF